MDKYEYKLKLEQLKNLVEEKDYKTAAEIADTINWRKVKSSSTLCMVGEIYDRNKQYENSRDILLMAYDRATVGRNIIYRLALVSLKMGNLEEAKEYYDEFLEIAPYDNLKYVLRYQIAKIEGASLEEQIGILEEFKSREYMEEWAFELAYLYHRSGNGEKCVEVCDELVLWFGDGKYVEKALELKMLYQPLNKEQEGKYRQFKTHQDEGPEVQPAELMESVEIIQDTVRIPDLTASSGRFNTLNLQEELAKGMQQIMEADTKETLSDTMHNIQKIVDEIPYLKVPQEEGEGKAEEERYGHIETDEEIDDSLETDFQELLAEDWDGQISFTVPGGDWWEPQVNGQIRIEEVLAEWEKTKRAAEAAMAVAQQRKLESAKARALQEAEELMQRLNQIIPKLNAGVTPQELLAERYLQNVQYEEYYGGQFPQENAGMEAMGEELGNPVLDMPPEGMPLEGMSGAIDPVTGMPMEGVPEQAGMVDPATGMPLEGMSGAIDPATGMPMEGIPEQAGMVDPATGMPLEGMSGMSGAIDPATGMPIGGMSGMSGAIDPVTGMPMEGVPEQAGMVDPVTGMPIEGMSGMEGAIGQAAGMPPMEAAGWNGYPANSMGAYPEDPFLGTVGFGKQFHGNNFGELAMQMSRTGKFDQGLYGMPEMGAMMLEAQGVELPRADVMSQGIPETTGVAEGMPMEEAMQGTFGAEGMFPEITQAVDPELEMPQTGQPNPEMFQEGYPMPGAVPTQEEIGVSQMGQEELELSQTGQPIPEMPQAVQEEPELSETEYPISEVPQTEQPEFTMPQTGQTEWEISQMDQPVPEPPKMEETMETSGLGAPQATGPMQGVHAQGIPQTAEPMQRIPQGTGSMQGTYAQGMPQGTGSMQGTYAQGIPQGTGSMQGAYAQGVPQGTGSMQGTYAQGMSQGTGPMQGIYAQGMPQGTGPMQRMPQGTGSMGQMVGAGAQSTAPMQQMGVTGTQPTAPAQQGAGVGIPQTAAPTQAMADARVQGIETQAPEIPKTEVPGAATRPMPQWEKIVLGAAQASSEEPDGQQAQEPAKPKKKDAEEYLESVFQAAKASREEKNQVSAPVLEPEAKHKPPETEMDLDEMGTAPMKAAPEAMGNTASMPAGLGNKGTAFAMPEIEVLPEQGTSRKLTEEEREIFSYFVPVNGMEQQLCQVLEGTLHRRGKSGTSATGNILIMGARGSGKTVLATDLIKVLQMKDGHNPGKVGKITGDSLNQKDLSQLLKKVAGGYLIIEKAGELAQETVTRLSLLMEQNTEGLLFLLEDTRKGLEKALSLDMNFAKKFTERIKIPVFTSDELVEFAKAYADEQECEIDDMGILALYNRISNIQKLDEATTLSEVKEIVDLAISSAERGGLKKIFGGKKFSPEGYLYLREKDFEE